MSVRVRFAPSPTGYVHIGNMRAAIFNWLFARHENGKFLLRIEDTDRERSTGEAKKTLFDAIEWLGLNYDEPVMYQSERTAQYLKAASELEKRGFAYRKNTDSEKNAPLVFMVPYFLGNFAYIKETQKMSVPLVPHMPVEVTRSGVKYGIVNKKGEVITEEACLAGFWGLRLINANGKCEFDLNVNVNKILSGEMIFTASNITKMEYVRREVFFKDLVKGLLSKPLDNMKDLVIVRSDGMPVFHLANVCDDIEQKITHIIRGDDHVENTYRHILLFFGLNVMPPLYAHLPMIVNQHGKPYSKRDGDAYVGDFKDKGFIAEALFNYLCLLGWSPGNDKEKMSREEIIKLFSLDRVKSGPAQMDLKKLTHLNWEYIVELPIEKFVEFALQRLQTRQWFNNSSKEFLRKVCVLMQSRTTTFADIDQWEYFFSDEVKYEDKEAVKLLSKEGVAAALMLLAEKLKNNNFTVSGIEKTIRDVEKEFSIQEGKLNQPVRAAVTGITRGAGLYETMEIIGKIRCIKRLINAAQKFMKL
mgnify:CR=1 FL=1